MVMEKSRIKINLKKKARGKETAEKEKEPPKKIHNKGFSRSYCRY